MHQKKGGGARLAGQNGEICVYDVNVVLQAIFFVRQGDNQNVAKANTVKLASTHGYHQTPNQKPSLLDQS